MPVSLNRVQIIGYLGKDPEVTEFREGGSVANLSIATSESWRDARDEVQERTQWHRVSIFSPRESGGLVDVAKKILKQGSRVFVEGQLETRSWDDNGTTKYATEVVIRPFSGQMIALDKAPERPASQQRSETRRQSGPSGRH